MLNKKTKRLKRKIRVRKKISGTPERPRLAVFRSLRHIYAQVIDDTVGRTLVEASSMKAGFKSGNRAAAKSVGGLIAERAKAKKIAAVAFDRGGFLFHGVVKDLADAARAGGLKF